ncbi:MAG: glyoxalase/bleomycin resistance/extradiol dioxygenase family protein [Chloroflexota bacterium]|nr:glyoxalase/bleomycin resistance/extradiol dioxygenase family protein [Chloroflexota bacterium]
MPDQRQIYLNLPVADLDRSGNFFKGLGFEFDPFFTDEKATCMIVGEGIYVMLLTRPCFEGFIPGKSIADASKTAEMLVAISAPDRDTVDAMIRDAVAAGGSEYREAQDHGWMYFRAFQDLDGHIWEVLATDESMLQEQMQQGGS